jgi:hypothetical protein
MYAYNVFLNNVRKYDVRRNAKSIIKKLYLKPSKSRAISFYGRQYINRNFQKIEKKNLLRIIIIFFQFLVSQKWFTKR